ncbi:MAG: hypothetical protein U0R26_02720 [Solirubrobacterales bacterium]
MKRIDLLVVGEVPDADRFSVLDDDRRHLAGVGGARSAAVAVLENDQQHDRDGDHADSAGHAQLSHSWFAP